MTETRSLLDYQRKVSEISARPAPVSDDEPRWGLAAATLYRAGWSYLVRGDVRIWCMDPENWRHCWKSEEIAYGIVKEEK